MLRQLDHLWLRFTEAFAAFRNPLNAVEQFQLGVELGKQIGHAQVRQKLDEHDPYQFTNNHFKLGYYFAYENVKKVMTVDEDNVVA